jgi:hypothetical protein
MTFDNSKTIIRERIRIFIVTMLLLTYVVLTYIAKLIEYPVLGISETIYTIIFTGIWLVFALYPIILNYQYVSFSDEGENIVFRYFLAGIFGGKKNSVEIRKDSFAGYKIETRYFGLTQSITLFQRMREGVAAYPPVFISNLSQKEKDRLINSLYLYTPKQEKISGDNMSKII